MIGLGCNACSGPMGLSGFGDEYGALWGMPAGQSTDPGALSTGYTWQDVFKQGAKGALSVLPGILTTKFGGMQPGTYVQQGQNVAYRLPEGQTGFNLSTMPGVSASSGSLLLYGGIALAGIIALKAISK